MAPSAAVGLSLSSSSAVVHDVKDEREAQEHSLAFLVTGVGSAAVCAVFPHFERFATAVGALTWREALILTQTIVLLLLAFVERTTSTTQWAAAPRDDALSVLLDDETVASSPNVVGCLLVGSVALVAVAMPFVAGYAVPNWEFSVDDRESSREPLASSASATSASTSATDDDDEAEAVVVPPSSNVRLTGDDASAFSASSSAFNRQIPRRAAAALVAALLAWALVEYTVLTLLLASEPLTWFVRFAFLTRTRRLLIGFWLVCLALLVVLGPRARKKIALPRLVASLRTGRVVWGVWTGGKETANDAIVPNIVVRKLFHAVAVVMFIPSVVLDHRFLQIAFAVALQAMLGVEILRAVRFPYVGTTVHRFMAQFIGTAVASILPANSNPSLFSLSLCLSL